MAYEQDISSDVTNENELKELLNSTVKPNEGEIPPFIFQRPDIYQLELDRIFKKDWLYVAHASEIPSTGDYVTRRMGEENVIVSRGEDNEIRVFLNFCRHRGNRISRTDMGNCTHFRCPYHGFTYSNKGNLVGVPYRKMVYGKEFEWSKFSLVQARSDQYDGLIFATWNFEGPSLDEYLGDMKWYMDIFFNRTELEVQGEPQKYEIRTNWKLPSENFASDSYHFMFTHQSLMSVGQMKSVKDRKNGYHVSTTNAHGCGISAPSKRLIFNPDFMDDYEKNLSEDQLGILKEMFNVHGNIAPNMSFLISAREVGDEMVCFTTIKQWQPSGPDKVEAWSWLLVEKRASDRQKEMAMQSYITNHSSSGMAEQDDGVNYEGITKNSRSGIAATVPLKYQMGMKEEPMTDFPGPGRVYQGKWHEANARTYYDLWMSKLLNSEGL